MLFHRFIKLLRVKENKGFMNFMKPGVTWKVSKTHSSFISVLPYFRGKGMQITSY